MCQAEQKYEKEHNYTQKRPKAAKVSKSAEPQSVTVAEVQVGPRFARFTRFARLRPFVRFDPFVPV